MQDATFTDIDQALSNAASDEERRNIADTLRRYVEHCRMAVEKGSIVGKDPAKDAAYCAEYKAKLQG